mgnify:CR=1 FL=1
MVNVRGKFVSKLDFPMIAVLFKIVFRWRFCLRGRCAFLGGRWFYSVVIFKIKNVVADKIRYLIGNEFFLLLRLVPQFYCVKLNKHFDRRDSSSVFIKRWKSFFPNIFRKFKFIYAPSFFDLPFSKFGVRFKFHFIRPLCGPIVKRGRRIGFPLFGPAHDFRAYPRLLLYRKVLQS